MGHGGPPSTDGARPFGYLCQSGNGPSRIAKGGIAPLHVCDQGGSLHNRQETGSREGGARMTAGIGGGH